MQVRLGDYVLIKTGKLDANIASENGRFPFFTCGVEPLKIDKYSYDCECVLVAGNGDLNVKYYYGKFDAYQRTYIIESKNKNLLSVKYLYFFLDNYLDTLRNEAIGGVIKYIKLSNLSEVKIKLLDLEKQLEIVNILEKINLLISLRKNQLKKLDELVKSRFIEMFGDPLLNPYNLITVKLGTVLTVEPQNGLYKPQSDYVVDKSGIPILRIDSFYNGQLRNLNSLKRLNCSDIEKKRYLLKENDIVINRVNSIEYLGKCALITGLVEDTLFESNMMRLHVDETKYNPVYVTYLLCSKFIYNQILSMAKKAVNQASINQKDVENFEIYMPNLNLQNKFADFVKQTDKSKLEIQKSLDKLEILKKSLMQQYFG